MLAKHISNNSALTMMNTQVQIEQGFVAVKNRNSRSQKAKAEVSERGGVGFCDQKRLYSQ